MLRYDDSPSHYAQSRLEWDPCKPPVTIKFSSINSFLEKGQTMILLNKKKKSQISLDSAM